ncbi:Asp-tRNA(Asn)/Glu-tRNA(Gln) amidotransferase subunit GatC [bacterium]|nr:Asp-tRNA(Asn)/Glu-tRNA(Gln) amidotransferase subunit GatC [bacterium]
MLSEKDVLNVAKLARINLSEEEKEKMRKDLTLILDYIAKIRELDLKNVEPTFHTLEIKNKTREDRAREQNTSFSKKLISLAPQKENGYIKIRSVFKDR